MQEPKIRFQLMCANLADEERRRQTDKEKEWELINFQSSFPMICTNRSRLYSGDHFPKPSVQGFEGRLSSSDPAPEKFKEKQETFLF